MSVLVLDGVVWTGGVGARSERAPLYLAKKLRSIAGHSRSVWRDPWKGRSVVRWWWWWRG